LIYGCAITIVDILKYSSVDAIKTLKKLGIEIVMLTGDNERTAKTVARNVGIDKVIANVLSGEKLLS